MPRPPGTVVVEADHGRDVDRLQPPGEPAHLGALDLAAVVRGRALGASAFFEPPRAFKKSNSA